MTDPPMPPVPAREARYRDRLAQAQIAAMAIMLLLMGYLVVRVAPSLHRAEVIEERLDAVRDQQREVVRRLDALQDRQAEIGRQSGQIADLYRRVKRLEEAGVQGIRDAADESR